MLLKYGFPCSPYYYLFSIDTGILSCSIMSVCHVGKHPPSQFSQKWVLLHVSFVAMHTAECLYVHHHHWQNSPF
jgi:hypothetical protein